MPKLKLPTLRPEDYRKPQTAADRRQQAIAAMLARTLGKSK